jgi:hypothetical protein
MISKLGTWRFSKEGTLVTDSSASTLDAQAPTRHQEITAWVRAALKPRLLGNR